MIAGKCCRTGWVGLEGGGGGDGEGGGDRRGERRRGGGKKRLKTRRALYCKF